MSIKVMSWVWDNSAQKGSGLLLLLALADHAHDDGGGAYPSIESLAQKIRMSERQVNRILLTLQEGDAIEIQRNEGPNGVNVYRVLMGVTKCHLSFGTGDIAVSSGGDKSLQGGDIAMASEGVTYMSPKPSLEPSLEPSRNQGGISSENEEEYLSFLTARGVFSVSDYRSKYHMPDTDPAMMVRRIVGIERKAAKQRLP